MILYIDTTDFNKAIFAISDGKKAEKKSYKIDPHKSHETLGYLEKFLKVVKIKPSPVRHRRTSSPKGRGREQEIAKIVVNKGPGSYTGVRVGVTIAQALGMAWGIPVKAVVKDKFRVDE